ncbi:thiol reductant ABC exporter subunit CydD [Pseudonocardia thermophila]|jgi:thiol reductant ABC exporter, CydD subunit/thiol reductant ABC exporter, CydC subunit|uniref:thiol reductant ABC exporter subunit CydD n=1 Tax=Pseudonocardia thermophila TaxID=1848 RepID=UPI00248F01B7|nr:thiol reductant ABC exporter subunit CydD [Pseudonocardia thermophila]
MKPLDPRLLRHASAARRFVLLTAGVAVLAAVLVLAQAQLLSGVLADAFLGGAALDVLAPALGALLAVVVGRALLSWAGEVAAHRAAADVIGELRRSLLAHVLRLGPRRPEVPPTAEIATLATRGLDGLDGYFSRYLPALLVAAVVPAVVAARILFADPLSGLIVALTVPLIPVFMILVGLHTERQTKRQWRSLAVLGHHFLDVVAGLDVLVAFGREHRQAGRIRELADAYRRTTMRTLRVAFLSALVLELLATLSVALVAVSIGLRLVEGRLDLATGLLVLILAPEVYLPLRAVGARFHDSAEGLAAAAETFAVLETPAETPRDASVPVPDPADAPLRLRGVVVDGRGGRVLDGLDLHVDPGTVLGVRGASGAGKSTLLDLLLGLRRPDEGAVLVGNIDLADVPRDAWLRRVAWVPQRPVLVAGTVADNIRLGNPRASVAEVTAAARAAALLDDPGLTLDTPVGEGGSGLSTGQRRRVALARAVLADRPLLLLDEPTEGVDAETEAAIIAALPAITACRTAVVVSHRNEVLAACDRVLDLGAPQRQERHPAQVPAGGQPPTGRTDVPEDRPPNPGHADRVTGDRHPVGRIAPLPALRAALEVVRPLRGRVVLAVALGALALGSGVALTATSAWLISMAALQPPVLTLMVAIVAVRAFGIGKGVLRYAERLVTHDVALRAGTALRVHIWEALVRIGPAGTARLRRGDLLTRLVGDVDAQQDLVARVIVPVGASTVVGIGVVACMAAVLPAAGVVAAIGFVAAAVIAPALTAWAALRSERRTADARGRVSARTLELLEAAPDLIVFGAADRRLRGVVDADLRLRDLLRRGAVARGLGSGASVLAIGATSVVATVVGIAALRAGQLPGPTLAVLALTPLALGDVVAALPDAAMRLLTATPAAQRLAELQRAPETVPDRPAAPVGTPRRLGAEELTVRWPGADRDAVRGVTLDVGPHRRLVITGPSGCGKSTVVAALMRTLPPVSGRVLADGRDAADLAPAQVRQAVAWCGPQAHLFDSTLRANLALAAPDPDDVDDETLIAALRAARLGDWFDSLPEGLDTPIGEHGGAVSGGERQRIGIARTLLANRPITIYDEPTAHLDPHTADALAQEILAATEDRAAIIVTHRPDQTPGLPQLRLGETGSVRVG